MRNLLTHGLHSAIDVLLRIRNWMRRKTFPLMSPHPKVGHSDSEKTFYVAAVNEILTDSRKFVRFRRIHDYREILEHVDFEIGKKYFARIHDTGQPLDSFLSILRENDSIGSPRQYSYGNLGLVSPTTLRYLSVALELRKLFGSQLGHIVEIGGGYGGQASILRKLDSYEGYEIYDLPEVQELARRFLAAQGITDVIFPALNAQLDTSYDLVISNYAFSELSRSLQEEYMNKILLKSHRGYMVMNSGRENKSGRTTGKFSLEEIRTYLPFIEVKEEVPKTGPDNYVITWSRV